uniref:Biotin carboxyl carrier protein of acetyl-CoA carboxylase n=1 Tax=Porolithon onkodes TaxID=231751 RepID=A0A2Z2KS51_9FLOR|nr:acetyl-CoA carboxylase biotin carboxyl carrier protein [Porolithon onkodes]ASB29726.1 acetyl-CoA carboxylase biotin carboxyl carrier protein [Porolithon onkodes]
MLLQTTELKKLLSTITKNKIEEIHIKSGRIKITINTVTKRTNLPSPLKNKRTKQENHSKKEKNINQINKEQDKYFTIVSPMIGTFYRSPAPNEKPFININNTVNKNETVCIIEAMKLMNEIESEVNGRIVEILVEDGDIVDCGQALMRVQKQ